MQRGAPIPLIQQPTANWQTMQSHVLRVGEMTGTFAEIFGAREIASCTGQLHDLGKYTPEFDERLHDGAQPIDHAAASAKIAFERWGKNAISKLAAGNQPA